MKARELSEIDNSYRTIFQKEEKKVSTEPYLKGAYWKGRDLMSIRELANEIGVKAKHHSSLAEQYQRGFSRGELEKASRNIIEAGERFTELGEALPTIMQSLSEARINKDKVTSILQASLTALNELISAGELLLETLRLIDIAEDYTTSALVWLKRAEAHASEAIGPY